MTFASADQIAKAVVAACECTGADPLTLYDEEKSWPMTQARALAFIGLCEALPEAQRQSIERLLGFARASSSNVLKTRRSAKWWREEWVDEVVGAILADEIDGEGAEEPAEPLDLPRRPAMPPQAPKPALRPRPMPEPIAKALDLKPAIRSLPSGAKVINRRRTGTVDMGEPPAGRSALDMRRVGAALPGSDYDGEEETAAAADDDPHYGRRRTARQISLAKFDFSRLRGKGA